MSDLFLSTDFATTPVDIKAALLGLLLAFLGGQTLAWVYMATHSGLSYSRSFVNSLVVIPVLYFVAIRRRPALRRSSVATWPEERRIRDGMPG